MCLSLSVCYLVYSLRNWVVLWFCQLLIKKDASPVFNQIVIELLWIENNSNITTFTQIFRD